jgi:hypothetical protein
LSHGKVLLFQVFIIKLGVIITKLVIFLKRVLTLYSVYVNIKFMSHESPFHQISTEEMYLMYPEPSSYYPPDRIKPEDRLPADPDLKTPLEDAVRVDTGLAKRVAKIIAREAAEELQEIEEIYDQPAAATTREVGKRGLLLQAANLPL